MSNDHQHSKTAWVILVTVVVIVIFVTLAVAFTGGIFLRHRFR